MLFIGISPPEKDDRDPRAREESRTPSPVRQSLGQGKTKTLDGERYRLRVKPLRERSSKNHIINRENVAIRKPCDFVHVA